MDNIYTCKKINNGLLLEKIYLDSNKYIIEKLDNGDIKLLYKINLTKANWQQIHKYDFGHSKIMSCCINNTITQKNNYWNVLMQVYKTINNPISIIKNTKLNCKLDKNEEKGFKYIRALNINVQRADSNKTLLEILIQSYVHNIVIKIDIKLKDGQVLCVNFVP